VAAAAILDVVQQYFPGFRGLVQGMQVLSPWDLEQEFGLLGGDIFHGRLSLDQLFSSRPGLGLAQYAMPVKGLYLCGSGAHPGGGVSGLPGRNAALKILG
jgi:phytoene dehydrogenase-like protein